MDDLGFPLCPVELMQENIVEHLRYVVVPSWYGDLIFMPERRSKRRPKKALYKRLLARSRRAQRDRAPQERGQAGQQAGELGADDQSGAC